jgi:hypothetical protein
MMHWLVHALYGSWIEMSMIIRCVELVRSQSCVIGVVLPDCFRLWFGGNRAVINTVSYFSRLRSLSGVYERCSC